jgi:hypothetical protein
MLLVPRARAARLGWVPRSREDGTAMASLPDSVPGMRGGASAKTYRTITRRDDLVGAEFRAVDGRDRSAC